MWSLKIRFDDRSGVFVFHSHIIIICDNVIVISDVSLVSAPLRSRAYINFGAPLRSSSHKNFGAPLRSSSHKKFGAPLRSSWHKKFGAPLRSSWHKKFGAPLRSAIVDRAPLRYSWPSSAPLCSSIRAHSCSSTVKILELSFIPVHIIML